MWNSRDQKQPFKIMNTLYNSFKKISIAPIGAVCSRLMPSLTQMTTSDGVE
jgi:hypothetical protein